MMWYTSLFDRLPPLMQHRLATFLYSITHEEKEQSILNSRPVERIAKKNCTKNGEV